MSEAAGALASLLRPLPIARACHEGWRSFVLGEGRVLIVAGSRADRDRALSATGPLTASAPMVSHSAATDHYAALTVPEGRIGLDMETVERVELNLAAQDSWLTPSERDLVEQSAASTVELACHWVLKEAYGKALGVGLALPLDCLGFSGRGGAILLDGIPAPGCSERWQFNLYQCAGVLFGTAHASSVR